MSASGIVRCNIPTDWTSNFSQCLYDWQGLEAGVLALIAAIIGVVLLQGQIKQERVHRADDISRRHNAARLTLPLALAAVSELVDTIAEQVSDEFETYGPDGFSKSFDAILRDDGVRTKFEAVSLSSETLESFQSFVESLDRAEDIRHMAELVASIQILLSRYNSFDLKQPGARNNLAGLLIDAAKVKLLNEKIFNYARFVDDSSFGIVGVVAPEQAWDAIHGKAQSLVFHRQSPDVFFPDLQNRIDGYKEHAVSPWNEKFGDS
jgi:hypothetical protein